MNNDELKKKIAEIILQGVHAEPLDNSMAIEIADALIEAGIGDVKEVNCELTRIEVLKRERFAEEHGFTPDCTPYYIAEQYKHRAEVAERALKNLAQFCAKGARCYLQSDEDVKERERELYDEWIKQAEKELSEKGK